MKNTIAFLVGILAIVAGAGFLISGLQDRTDKAEFAEMLNAARVASAQQIPLIVQVPDDKIGYDRQQFMRKHTDSVNAAYKAHPQQKHEDKFILDLEEKAKKGEKDKAKTAEYRERYDYVKRVWNDKLKDGAYKTALTGHDHGIRVDILDIKQTNDGGQQSMRMDVLIWGALKDQFTAGSLETQSVIELEELEKAGKNKGKPKQGIVKVSGSALPYVLVDEPWQWLPEWPPGVMVGYYVGLPLFHPKAAKYNFTIDFSQRTQGGTVIPVVINWKDLAVDPGVRGAPGSKWDAEVAEASDEELKEAGIPVE
jgi:hypothetical protein